MRHRIGGRVLQVFTRFQATGSPLHTSLEVEGISLKHAILQFAGVTALSAGLALAQNPGLSQRSSEQPHQWRHSQDQSQSSSQTKQDWAARRLERLSTMLNLTADQQQQARTIFSDTSLQARPLMRQIHQSRKALSDAVKAGNTGEIDSLASAQAPLLAQMTAIHAKGLAKFYSILSADQKAKFDTMGGHTAGMFMSRMGKHHQ